MAANHSHPKPHPEKNLHFSPMHIEDLHEVMEIENAVYPYPWHYESYRSSVSNNDAWVMRGEEGTLIGYFVSMHGYDETHLLTIAVHPGMQHQGYGKILLDKAILRAYEAGMSAMILEVRPSNTLAKKMYDDYGFLLIGIRRNYYLNDNNTREDALVMRLKL